MKEVTVKRLVRRARIKYSALIIVGIIWVFMILYTILNAIKEVF